MPLALPEVPQYTSVYVAALALGVSLMSLLWQAVIQRQKVRQDLYEKRFDILQTIIKSMEIRMGAAAAPSSTLSLSVATEVRTGDGDALFRKTCGHLSADEGDELFSAMQHVRYLYDKDTHELADGFYEAMLESEVITHELFQVFRIGEPPAADWSARYDANTAKIQALHDRLFPHLARELTLFRDPWWVRLKSKIAEWKRQAEDI